MSDVASPTRRALLEARFTRVRRDLDEVVGRLNQELMDWAPRDGMRTVAGQLVEIIGTELQCLAQLRGEPVPSDDEVRATLGDWHDLPTLTQALADVRGRTLEYIRSFSEAGLEEPVSMPSYWFESLGFPKTPRAEVLTSLAAHEWYHVGQLVSYLWSRGDDPYKW